MCLDLEALSIHLCVENPLTFDWPFQLCFIWGFELNQALGVVLGANPKLNLAAGHGSLPCTL